MAGVTTRRLDVLRFEVSERRYALPSASVREVVRAVRVEPLPKAPAIVEGVVNARGTIVPVFDLRARFGLPPKPLDHADHFVFAWAGRRLAAIRADRALDLVSLDAEQIEDARSAVPGADYVAGVAKLPDGLLLIHDLATFLSEAEARTLDEALPGGDAQ